MYFLEQEYYCWFSEYEPQGNSIWKPNTRPHRVITHIDYFSKKQGKAFRGHKFNAPVFIHPIQAVV